MLMASGHSLRSWQAEPQPAASYLRSTLALPVAPPPRAIATLEKQAPPLEAASLALLWL